ncbi:MAG: PEP-CTERM sorting domain-containing protein [Planctomycetota bacterium]|nr:PEP-CTERM sorting domain-containing protein [Planctomycetota bacterium]
MKSCRKSQTSVVSFGINNTLLLAALIILVMAGPHVLAVPVVNGVAQSGTGKEGSDPSLDPLPGTTIINFDDVTAPCIFADTTPLSEQYDSLGVHFHGPGGNDGGAILNQCSNFGISAASGANFLAFNRDVLWPNGGAANDPETILFDYLMTDVSIYAAGGYGPDTFTMRAYDAADVLVDTDTITTTAWGPLSVSWADGIKYIILQEAAGDGAFVYDNLSFTPVPEPVTLLLLGLGARILIKRHKV